MLKLYYADIAPLCEQECFVRNMELVHEARRNQLMSIKSREAQCRGLAATLLLRMALEQEHISYGDSVISHNEHGKPKIMNSNLHFNMSHAGNYAVCAVCNQPIGVDIENLTRFEGRIRQMERLANRVLTDDERKLWERSEKREWTLLEIWTRKESYVKMTGSGLSVDLRGIDTLRDVFYQHMSLEDRYYVSVCTAEPCGEMKVFDGTNEFIA